MEFNEILKMLRNERGYTQEQLAKMIGVAVLNVIIEKDETKKEVSN